MTNPAPMTPAQPAPVVDATDADIAIETAKRLVDFKAPPGMDNVRVDWHIETAICLARAYLALRAENNTLLWHNGRLIAENEALQKRIEK